MQRRNQIFLALFGVVSFLFGIWVSSPTPVLLAFEPSAKATATISKRMNADQVDNLHAAKTPQANKLIALDGNAKFPSSVIPNDFQRRVTDYCPDNSAIRAVNTDGTVICENIPSALATPTTIATPVATPTPLNFSSNGFVKAGVFAMCDGTNPTIYRSFNTVNNTAVTITGGLLGHNCIIDFGFDDSNRYIVVTPVYNPDNIIPIRAAVKDDFGTWAVVTLWDGNDNYVGGKIFVQVY